jgi:hypothetical protein
VAVTIADRHGGGNNRSARLFPFRAIMSTTSTRSRRVPGTRIAN